MLAGSLTRPRLRQCPGSDRRTAGGGALEQGNGTAELTAELITGLRYAENPAIRADGGLVAYVVGTLGRRDEHRASAIWLAGPGTPPRQLTAGETEDTLPRWSHDGSALYFLSDRAKRETAQLYRIDPAGGEAQRLTDCQPGIAGPARGPEPKLQTARAHAVDPSQTLDKPV